MQNTEYAIDSTILLYLSAGKFYPSSQYFSKRKEL